MRLSYELYIRREVFQVLEGIAEPTREKTLRFMELLSEDPFREGDFTARDDTGRLVQAKLIGEYALYYWADHAAREVRLLDLVDAGSVDLSGLDRF
jgi:hypothetical protein